MPSDNIILQPVFLLFIALTFLLAAGYFWGRRKNKNIIASSLGELTQVINPTDQTFTNIGGAIGYHATFLTDENSVLSNAEITITLLPRQAWLYFPISLLIRRWDQLYITLNLKTHPPAEGHLIEKSYASFRGPKITNEEKMKREDLRWGEKNFILFYTTKTTRNHFLNLIKGAKTPGRIKHIAFVPNQKKCFIFMIPQANNVAADFAPVFDWLPSTLNRR